MFEQPTTTTPPGKQSFCLHPEFRSSVKANRHEQTTDGVMKVEYTVSLSVKCVVCNHSMRFPMPDGSFAIQASTPMVE